MYYLRGGPPGPAVIADAVSRDFPKRLGKRFQQARFGAAEQGHRLLCESLHDDRGKCP